MVLEVRRVPADVSLVGNVVGIILQDPKQSGMHHSTYVVKVLTLSFLKETKLMHSQMTSVVFVDHESNSRLCT
jgi:hypothetical protein